MVAKKSIQAQFIHIPDSLPSLLPKEIHAICPSTAYNRQYLHLQIHDAFTVHNYSAKIYQKEAIFRIKDSLSSGMARLSLWDDKQQIAEDSTWIVADTTFQVDTYLGPKNVPADGVTQTMMVVLPTDIYGNPVAEGTPTRIETLRKHNQSKVYENKTQYLAAWKEFVSSTQAGKVFIKSQVGNCKGIEKVSEECPNAPADFIISPQGVFPKAEEKRCFYLVTDKIKDKFGNTVTDGTAISFMVIAAKGTTSYYMASTIEGIAKVKIISPSQSDDLTIKAFFHSICKSNTLQLHFD